MIEGMRLDEVTVFDGKLTFLVPQQWVEQDDQDDGIYLLSDPSGESGWLRASLITLEMKDTTDPEGRLREMFSDSTTAKVNEESGNWVDRWEKDSVEDGIDIHLYYWKVANFARPNFIREAVFSYTVLASQLNADTEELVGLLDQILSRAKLA